MKIVAVGSRGFVSGFQLAGITGTKTDSSDSTLKEINTLLQDKEVGLILVSDDVAKPIRDKLTAIKAKRPVPLIYEIPAPGSKKEKIEYRDMLRKILGV